LGSCGGGAPPAAERRSGDQIFGHASRP